MSSSIEEMQKTMNDTMMSIVKELDDKFLRKLQADSFRCASECYERPGGTPELDNNCSNRCLQDAARAQNIISSTLEAYNQTLANCVKTCNGNAQFAEGGESEKERQFFSCASKCVQDFVSRKNSVTSQCLQSLQQIKR